MRHASEVWEGALGEALSILPEAAMAVDLEGRVVLWNPAAERLTGRSAGSVLGQTCGVLRGDGPSACLGGPGPRRCGLLDRGSTVRRCQIRAADGRLLDIVKSATPLLGRNGEYVGALETFAAVPPLQVRPEAPAEDPLRDLVGESEAMSELRQAIGIVAPSDTTVLVLGESGVGKERVVEALHRASRRARGPFVVVNCSALSFHLLESELFGHVRGAFTGATQHRRGRFEEADGGTLFLDEIGDVEPEVQVKLLRAVERREIDRVGESRARRVDVRIVCATNRELEQLVKQGRFRADLYFRLSVFPLRVPPLRERPADVPLLTARFLADCGGRHLSLSPEVRRKLLSYPWPGNVRELQNAVQYAVLHAGAGPTIRLEHLPAHVREHVAGPRLITRSPEALRQAVEEALAHCGGNRTAASRELGISRVTLWKWMRRTGLQSS